MQDILFLSLHFIFRTILLLDAPVTLKKKEQGNSGIHAGIHYQSDLEMKQEGSSPKGSSKGLHRKDQGVE